MSKCHACNRCAVFLKGSEETTERRLRSVVEESAHNNRINCSRVPLDCLDPVERHNAILLCENVFRADQEQVAYIRGRLSTASKLLPVLLQLSLVFYIANICQFHLRVLSSIHELMVPCRTPVLRIRVSWVRNEGF